MPDSIDHMVAANRNEKFAIFIFENKPEFKNWAVTGYFYSALHLVDSYLDKIKVNAMDHRTRNSYISRESKLRPIYKDYSELESQSRRARYTSHMFSDAEVNDATDTFKKVKKHMSGVL